MLELGLSHGNRVWDQLFSWFNKNCWQLSIFRVRESIFFENQPCNIRPSGGGLVAKLCPTLVILWTVAYQVLPSMGFSRQEYWNGLPFPPPGVLPNQGSKPGLQHCRRFFITEPPGMPPNSS